MSEDTRRIYVFSLQHGSLEISVPATVSVDECDFINEIMGLVMRATRRRAAKQDAKEATVESPVARVAERDACEHGIHDGDWCPACNAEYKRARAANGDEA